MQLCQISKAQSQEQNEIKYKVFDSEEIGMDSNIYSFIIPILLTQQISFNNIENNHKFGLILIELFIDLPIEYKISLVSRDQQKADRIFKSLNGYHYLKYNSESDTIFIQLSLIDENQSILTNRKSILEQNRQLTISLIKNKQYSLRILEQQQNRCPFNCHGNGICQDDHCKCNYGYSESYNCQIKIDHFMVQKFDETQQISSQQPDISDEWNYSSIGIQQIDQIKKKLLISQQMSQQLVQITIIFWFDTNSDKDRYELTILNKNNYFQPLISKNKDKNVQQSNSYTINIDTQRLLYDEQYSKELIIIGWKSNINNLNILLQYFYFDNQIFFQSFQLFLWVSYSILVFSTLSSSIIKKSKISIFEINMSIQKKEFKNITQKDLQILIKQQISIFNFENSPQQDLENGTYKECYICLCEYQTQDELCKTQCGHVFHKNCLDFWLEKNIICPLDRKQLLEIK